MAYLEIENFPIKSHVKQGFGDSWISVWRLSWIATNQIEQNRTPKFAALVGNRQH